LEKLSGMKVAVVATDGFEEMELTEPVRALRDAGARVEIVAPHPGKIQGFRHHDKAGSVDVEVELGQILPENYDAVLLPGGALNADALRVDERLQSFLRHMQAQGKPIAAICHAPWELVSAGLVRGRRLTAYHTIRDDVQNAGGIWMDEEAVVDGNWVTSRKPSDIPAFNREMLSLFEHHARSLTAQNTGGSRAVRA
jgi:protease I